jgi:cell wall-associated NlpC family hydrolase
MAEPRLLKIGAKGRDVRAVQRALRKAGFRPKADKITNVFDAALEAQVKEFQRARGLPDVDGEVGTDTYAALAPHFDAFSRLLLERAAKAGEEATTTRQKIVAAAHCGYANRERVRYTQTAQRMEGVRRRLLPPTCPEFEDCSSFVTWCYFAAGAPDPNGLAYNGFGYTGTQIGQGQETSRPKPGDLVFYGHSKTDINHVTLYVGNGKVISHGQESGPQLFPIDYGRGSFGGRQQIRKYLP